MNREDRVHGALLILNELVRISSMEGEVRPPTEDARAPRTEVLGSNPSVPPSLLVVSLEWDASTPT